MKNVPKILATVYLLISFFVLIVSFILKSKFSEKLLYSLVLPWSFLLSFLHFLFHSYYFHIGFYFVLISLNGIILYMVGNSIVNYLMAGSNSFNLSAIPKANPLKSKVGLWLVIIYLFLSIIIILSNYNCHDLGCGIILLYINVCLFGNIYPGFDGFSFQNLVTTIFKNSIVIYLFGMIIQIIINKFRSRIP